MPELGVAWEDVDDRHNSRELPRVGATAVKVGSDKLDRSRRLVSAPGPVEGEGGVGVVGVADPHVVDGLGVVQLLDVGVVRQPGLVPVVDPVEVGCVVESGVSCEIFWLYCICVIFKLT